MSRKGSSRVGSGDTGGLNNAGCKLSDGAKKMRVLLRKACEAAGADKLAWKVLSIVPDEVLEQMALLTGKEAKEAERHRCAKLMHVTSQELLLAAGEMTAQELRTVKAVLKWKEAQIVKGDG